MTGDHVTLVDVFKDNSTLEFVERSLKSIPKSICFLAPAFLKALLTTYSLKGWYLIYTQSEQLCGIASLYLKRNVVGQNALVTVPRGFWAEDEKSAERLFEASRKLAASHDLYGPCFQDLESEVFKNKQPEVIHTAVIELPKRKEDIETLLSKNLRKDIRKAKKNGIEISLNNDLNSFYKVLAQRMRDMGTPVVPFSFLANIKSFMRDDMTLLLAKLKGRCIGGAILLTSGDTLLGSTLGCLTESLRFRTAPYLYYNVLQFAVESGYKRLDLGRSQPGTGNERFKLRFGAKLEPLYSYGLRRKIRANDAIGKTIASAWKKLPLSAANFLGPRIRKYVPFG